MQKIIAYLKANWKHLSVALIMALYNILVGSGVVPTNDQLIINAILAALGIAVTKNSGTNDAVKSAAKILLILVMLSSLTGCATVFGGKISDCQRTKPAAGEPSRRVRIIPLLFDSPVGWLVDFSDGAIYKPCKNGGTK